MVEEKKISERDMEIMDKLSTEMGKKFEEKCMNIMGFDTYDVINLTKEEFKSKIAIIGMVFGTLTIESMTKMKQQLGDDLEE